MSTAKAVSPHARKFGVEIECGFPGGPNAVRRLLGFGESWRHDGWIVGSDGSGVELKTPPLQGQHGFEILAATMDKLKENGAYVTEADGMHVHHDAPEFASSFGKTHQLVHSWVNNIRVIEQMVHPDRRDYDACPPWREHDLRTLDDLYRMRGEVAGEAIRQFYYFGRHDLNIMALSEHGTVEIRLHEGTLDPDVAVAWIQFGQRFLHGVLRRAEPLDSAADDLALMKRLRLSKKAQEIMADKKAKGHLTLKSAFRPWQDEDDEDYDDDGAW